MFVPKSKRPSHVTVTPRPNEDQVEVIKERWRNVRGLDPEAGSVQRGAHYIDNDEL